jgi:hypothetical protein
MSFEHENIKELEIYKNGVAWDEDGWHYVEDAKEAGPLTCQNLFVVDALNFCFWPSPGLEYDSLAIGLRKVLEEDSTAFDASRLIEMDEETLQRWIPDYPLPNIEERVKKVRELGKVLLERFDGKASNVVMEAHNSADRLVRLITDNFPGFRDATIYNSKQVFFYKRAQILVADIWGAYGKQSAPHPFGFYDINELTMFADYRVPQILREYQVMHYTEKLDATIDRLEVIPYGSEEEVEIRAATVETVEILRHEVNARGLKLMSIELDWILWQKGEALKDEIKPHHRTATIFY